MTIAGHDAHAHVQQDQHLIHQLCSNVDPKQNEVDSWGYNPTTDDRSATMDNAIPPPKPTPPLSIGLALSGGGTRAALTRRCFSRANRHGSRRDADLGQRVRTCERSSTPGQN